MYPREPASSVRRTKAMVILFAERHKRRKRLMPAAAPRSNGRDAKSC